MSVFVDTSALYAVLDRDDPNHAAALEAFERLAGVEELVTHNYVYLETEQLVRRRLGSEAAVTLIDQLLPALTTIWVDEPVHASAMAEIRGLGQSASLVDQVSFILMRREGITRALAFDADFKAEGFGWPDLPGRSPGHRLGEERAPYPDEPDVVSVAEVAQRSGHSVNTVQSWRRRHSDFPPPLAELAAGPIWNWPAVAEWVERRSPVRRRSTVTDMDRM